MRNKKREPRALTTAEPEEEETLPEVEFFGDPGAWELIHKATMEGWVFATQRYKLPNGALYRTETQRRNPDGSYALSQAVAYVPA